MSNIIAVTDANFEDEVEKHDGLDHRRLLGDVVRPVPHDRADSRSACDGVSRERSKSPSSTSTRTSRRVRASTFARSRRCCSSRAARSSIRSSARCRKTHIETKLQQHTAAAARGVTAVRCARWICHARPLAACRVTRHLRADMSASPAALRFPYSRVLLASHAARVRPSPKSADRREARSLGAHLRVRRDLAARGAGDAVSPRAAKS